MDYRLIIVTFVVTALWDVVLRFMSLNFKNLPTIFQMKFVKYLTPYFKKHTLISAALIAGFIGATAQSLILLIMSFPTSIFDITYIGKFMSVTFIISALYGFLMKWSNLFPYLEMYYYDNLGVVGGMYHDGVSGLIVQITLLCFLHLTNSIG